jgi:HSP20 family protein
MKSFGAMLEIARIQSEVNRLFENLLDLGADDPERGAWIPNVDVVEGEEALLVKVELPGVEPADLSVAANGDQIILRGEKRRPEFPDGAHVHVTERAFGKFRRVIQLGVPVNTHRAEAVLHEGLLRIRFPKVPNRRGEEVPIEVKAS